MAVLKKDLMSELRTMQEEMNRLFDLSRNRLAGESLENGMWEPPADILEDDREVVVKLEIPEVDPEDVDIRIEEGILSIEGERKPEDGGRENSYLRIERSYGRFRRDFAIPSEIDRGGMRVASDRGVLRIALPKSGAGEMGELEESKGK